MVTVKLSQKKTLQPVLEIIVSSVIFRFIGFGVLYFIPRITRIGKFLDLFFFYQGLWAIIAGGLKEYFRVITVRKFLAYFLKRKKAGMVFYLTFLLKSATILYATIFISLILVHWGIGFHKGNFRIFLFTGVAGYFLLVGGILTAMFVVLKKYVMGIAQTPVVNTFFLLSILMVWLLKKNFVLDILWAVSNILAYFMILSILLYYLHFKKSTFVKSLFRLSFSMKNVKKYLQFFKDYSYKIFPLMLGFYIYAVSPFIDQWFGLNMREGGVSLITYGFKISFIGFSVFYGVINTFFLREFHFLTIKKFLNLLLILTFFNFLYVLALLIIGKYIAVIILKGKITSMDMQQLFLVIKIYVFSLMFALYIEFFNKMMFTKGNFSIPFVGGILNLISHVLMFFWVSMYPRVEMIPYTMLVSNFLNLIVLSVYLIRKISKMNYVGTH